MDRIDARIGLPGQHDLAFSDRTAAANTLWFAQEGQNVVVRGDVNGDGQVERMNRTIKEATVKRFHYDDHNQLRTHLTDFMDAYNFARRLKTLGGLTPYEYICKIWTSEPDKFILNAIHQIPGPNTY